MCECRRQQSKDSSSRLLSDSVSSTSSRDSPDDVISRCSAASSDVVHNSRTDDVTATSCANTVPTLCPGTVPPTILLTDGTVPEALDYRSMLVGAALARQQMMTSLSHYDHRNYQQYHHPHHRNSRRFTPYVITNDFIPNSFRPA